MNFELENNEMAETIKPVNAKLSALTQVGYTTILRVSVIEAPVSIRTIQHLLTFWKYRWDNQVSHIMSGVKNSMKSKQNETPVTENTKENWMIIIVYLRGKVTYLKTTRRRRTASKVNLQKKRTPVQRQRRRPQTPLQLEKSKMNNEKGTMQILSKLRKIWMTTLQST